MREAAAVDDDGTVWLPDRRHGRVGSVLHGGVALRDFAVADDPHARIVELVGTGRDGVPPDAEVGDAVVARLDHDDVLALGYALLALADRIATGEVRG